MGLNASVQKSCATQISIYTHLSLSKKKLKNGVVFLQTTTMSVHVFDCSKETKARIRYGYCKTYRRTTIYTYLHIIAIKQKLFFLHYPNQSQGF